MLASTRMHVFVHVLAFFALRIPFDLSRPWPPPQSDSDMNGTIDLVRKLALAKGPSGLGRARCRVKGSITAVLGSRPSCDLSLMVGYFVG